jgi:hypothetical protein
LNDAGNYGKTRKNTIIVQEILTIEQAQKKNMDTIEFCFLFFSLPLFILV